MNSNKATDIVRADDFIEYFLFPSLDELSGNDLEEKLNNFSLEVNKHVKEFIGDYIWHKDSFQLIPKAIEITKLYGGEEEDGMLCCIIVNFE